MSADPIWADADYRQALAEIETLMSAQLDTPEGKRLRGYQKFCVRGVVGPNF